MVLTLSIKKSASPAGKLVDAPYQKINTKAYLMLLYQKISLITRFLYTFKKNVSSYKRRVEYVGRREKG